MTSFLTDLGKPYVEKLINGAIAESRYICCFTCIAEEFEQEKVRLEAERTTVEQHVEVATGRGENVQSNALYWKEEADKLIQEDTKTKQKCFFGLCPHCIWRYTRGKELANKTDQIKRLMEEAKEIENVGLPARLPGVERYSSQHYLSFKSRELNYKELLDALKDDNNYITGLQGMGGTGKTTLAKEVGKKLKQFGQFAHVVDTTVSYTPDIKKIQDDIAGPLGLTLGDCNESDRPKKLWSRLTNGEKTLLILDDVWGDINFDEIGIPYSDNHKGCRILITTRNLWVCNKMGCGRTIQLELLTEEDAWVMFKRHAGLSDSSHKSLLDKGRKIANECKGLPVAIAAIASSLKGQQRREEWDMALQSLKKHVSMHGVDGDLVGIYKCLQFSYDYMKDEKAKRLFLLCSVFPEDEEISIEILTRLGIGAGLFGEDYRSYDDARNQVVISKNNLLDSCLLLEAGKKCVKMHDLVRDAAQWIANKEIRTVNLSHKDQKSLVEREKNIKYLFCEGKVMDVFFSRFGGFKLEILIAIFDMDKDHDCAEVPNSLFENIAGLRALHLNNKWSHRCQLALSLPQSIRSLTNIRSLLVDGVDLGDISILGNLQSLEAIDLVHCKINELPHEITKLEKLRLLKLEYCEIRRNNPFEVIRICSSLEELYFEDSFNSFCQEISFPKLHRYHVCRGLGLAIENTSLSKCVAFNGAGNVGFLSEATFKDCMQTTEILRLREIRVGWRNLIPEIVPIDEGMTDLVELGLRGISQLERLIDTIDSHVRNALSKLVVLYLRDMENLEELCNCPLSFDSLKSLEKLKIANCQHLRSLFKGNPNLCNLKTMRLRECPMLVSLFQLSTSQRLVQLEELHITDCERLENIIIDEKKEEKEESREEIVDGDNDNKSRGSMFPKLKVLDIDRCPRLEFIFQFPSAQDLLVLETIIIEKCDELKCIFGQYVQLGSLKEIHLHALPNFIDIFPERYHPMSSSVKGSSSTSSDGFKEQTQLDPIKCKKNSWTNICCYGHKYRHKSRSTTSTKLPFVSENQPYDCSIALESNSYGLHIWERAQCLSRQSQIMCNIKKITLSNLSKIKSVFILSIAPKMMLETLTIRNCDELKHIIVDTADDSGGNNWGNVFPKLREVSIKDCMQLEYIFGHYAHDHRNHNEIHLHLPTLECLNLYNLPSLIAMCPKKYRTTFPPLTKLGFSNCSQVALKSIGDFIIHLVSRSLDNTTIKELSGNVEHFLSLERLKVYNSKVENIFFFNEINGQRMNLGLQDIELHDLPVMTYLFVGPKNFFALQNLIKIKIERCEKLEIIFSTSIIRWLPQLLYLKIEECKELKHIIEDDVENQKMSTGLSSRTCFQKLQVLAVINCHKLKCVFPASICKKIPELEVLVVREADELEEILGSEDDKKWEIPNLKVVAFVNLPSLCQAQGIQFQDVKNRFVQNCQKLSLTSARTANVFDDMFFLYGKDIEMVEHLFSLFGQLSREESKTQDTSDEKPSAETTKDFAVGPEVEAVSRGDELTSSQTKTKQTAEAEHGFVENNVPASLEIPSMPIPPTNSEKLLNEQSMGQQCLMNQQHPLDTTVKPSQGNNGIKRSDEEGTALANAKTITPSTHSESVNPSSGPLVVTSEQHKPSSQDDGDGQIAIPSISIATTEPFTNENVETSDPVSLNDDASMKLSSINVEEQFPKDYEIRVSGPKPSQSTPSVAAASQSPSMPSQGDPSQVVEDLSSFSLVTGELEQLVSKKHLAHENLSLLTDFLVKHPSVRLTDNSLSNRYKGHAYNCLAELLKFLHSHSVLDVLESSHSEFVELLQDARCYAFDEDWLNGIERRVLLPSIQFSQDALQKLLDSKQQATKEVEVLRLKIDILTQHVEDLKHQLTSSEAVLESIIQKEAQVLEARAALSTPIGY